MTTNKGIAGFESDPIKKRKSRIAPGVGVMLCKRLDEAPRKFRQRPTDDGHPH
jgi:hypothetical protein